MSNPNPMSRIPPEYDELQSQDYDPQYTADINTKMRVPDNIRISNEAHGDYMNTDAVGYSAASMQISDRIVIMGQDQHAELKPEPDLRLDFGSNTNAGSYVGLSTPPRTLTLDERPFPVVDDVETSLPRTKGGSEGVVPESNINGYVRQHSGTRRLSGQFDSSMVSNEGLLLQDDIDDLSQVRRQMAKLSRHVMRLEEENAHRAQREMILYPILIGYFLLKMASWLVRSN